MREEISVKRWVLGRSNCKRDSNTDISTVNVNKRILLAYAGKMLCLLVSFFHEKPDGPQERDKKSLAPQKQPLFYFRQCFTQINLNLLAPELFFFKF